MDPVSAAAATEFYFSLMDLASSYAAAGQRNRCPLAREAVALLDSGSIRQSELAYSNATGPMQKMAAECAERKQWQGRRRRYRSNAGRANANTAVLVQIAMYCRPSTE